MLEQTWCKCCTLIPGKIRDCWSRIIFRYIDKSEGYSRHLVKESWNLVREGGWVVYGMFARVMKTRREKCFAGLFANGTAYEMARSVSTIPFPWRQTVDINAFLQGIELPSQLHAIIARVIRIHRYRFLPFLLISFDRSSLFFFPIFTKIPLNI